MGSLKIKNKILKEINTLSKNPNNLKDYSRFHKDNKNHISLASPLVKNISLKYFKEIKDLDKDQIIEICEELLNSHNKNLRTIAFYWAFRIKDQLEEGDFKVFEKWLEKYVDTWGSCDDLCTHAFGHLIYKFPKHLKKIDTWTKSKNKWVRRASVVIFIYSARKSKYLKDSLKISEVLLLDKEDLVQKGYGWLLKEISNKNQKLVFDFVIKYKKVMPRTALRYAIEKMPNQLRKQAMQKD